MFPDFLTQMRPIMKGTDHLKTAIKPISWGRGGGRVPVLNTEEMAKKVLVHAITRQS
jgi:hypothetical protein